MIVEDDVTEQEYLKLITKFKNKSIKKDDFYIAIFKELQNIQTSKKNSLIENKVIKKVLDVLDFERHLKILDIDTFLICRIVGVKIFEHKSIPLYFSIYTNKLPIEDAWDLIQECNSNLSRCLFNKTSNKVFWNICETIIDYLNNYGITDVDTVFCANFGSYKPRYSYLDEVTIKYLTALIIEGSK